MRTRRALLSTAAWGALGLVVLPAVAWGGAGAQPFFASVRRVLEALERAGSALPSSVASELQQLASRGDDDAVARARQMLAPFVIADVTFNAQGDGDVKVTEQVLPLVEQGWRSFLVGVQNPAGLQHAFLFGPTYESRTPGQDQAASNYQQAHHANGDFSKAVNIARLRDQRAGVSTQTVEPLRRELAGMPFEYRIVHLIAYRRGPGSIVVASAARNFPADRAVWNPESGAVLTFNATASRDVEFRVRDADGRTVVASITIRDSQRRIYPDKQGRLAPDMYFQDHVYRASGETVRLPDGSYEIVATRGPEYEPVRRTVSIAEESVAPIEVQLKRWVDPARHGWYSGDVHIHAAGCKHYSVPSVGVTPETMIRHVRGEGLWVGEVLTWAPGFAEQKKFFTGSVAATQGVLEHHEMHEAMESSLVPKASEKDPESMLRYDIEVSGFPSSHSGHPILMQLKEQDYPGTSDPTQWPTWNLPIFQWAKAQGGVVGFGHCGVGLEPRDARLPSFEVPTFRNVGANEFLVDIAHDAVDFLSGGSTSPLGELNIWYHSLNCGFRAAMVGETDWPCITDERVGGGRTYVRLEKPPQGDAGYGAWVAGIQAGRLYMGDGRSHALKFEVGGVGPGSELQLPKVKTVRVRALVAALLDAEDTLGAQGIRTRPWWRQPSWHLERARVPGSRNVLVEIVVNGEVQMTRPLVADGRPTPIDVEMKILKSSWVALRILGSLHTQPVFVLVGDQPIRASRRSAQWCIQCIDVLARSQLPRVKPSERPAAEEAYREARSTFERRAAESDSA